MKNIWKAKYLRKNLKNSDRFPLNLEHASQVHIVYSDAMIFRFSNIFLFSYGSFFHYINYKSI